ncbi:MAG: uracil phosphoribosyltransferase [Thermomicrobiales bacterium]
MSEAAFPNLHVSHHPLTQHKVTHLREERTDGKTFRELVRELTGLLIYEATVDLATEPFEIVTPMESMTGSRLAPRVAFVPILRAGIGMVEAAIDAVPGAIVYHLGMYRDEATHQPVHYYNKLPAEVNVDVVFVLDPMLATGGSACDAIAALEDWGATDIRFISIISAPKASSACSPSIPRYRSSPPRSTASSMKTPSSFQDWATPEIGCSEPDSRQIIDRKRA